MQWKSNIFLYIENPHRRLSGAILRLIERQRSGETINQGLVKEVIDSFVSLGLGEKNVHEDSHQVYREHFQNPFLEGTEKYYREESKALLAENGVFEYLKKVEGRIREEEERLQRGLSMVTRENMMNILVDVFVNGHKDIFLNTFKSFFLSDTHHSEDVIVRWACKVLDHFPVDPELKSFHSILEKRVKKMGLDAVRELVGENVDQSADVDPAAYAHTLLRVHCAASDLVARSFNGWVKVACMASVDKACREFVNCNAATGSSSTKSPELLAKYADALLQKNNKMAEEDLEGALNKVVRIRPWIVPIVALY